MAYEDSEYPGAIDTFRTQENIPGQTYDGAKSTTIFKEDFEKRSNAIIALENALGVELANVIELALVSRTCFGVGASVGTSTTGPGFNKMNMNVENYDFGGVWDASIQKFVAQYDCVYHFNASIGQGSQTICLPVLYKNGVEIARGTDYRPTNGGYGGTISRDLMLEEGDTVELYLYVQSNGTTYFDPPRCGFQGHLVRKIV